MVDQTSWLAQNWEAVSMIVTGVLALLGITGKALTLWRALRFVMDNGEVPEDMAESTSPSVSATIRNMKARVSPDPAEKPKIRDALKGVAVDAVAGLIGKLFNRGKK